MALTNLKVVNDELTNQTRAQAAIESYNAKADERAVSRPVSIRKGQHLDVDEVLARSLPKVAGEVLGSGKKSGSQQSDPY